VHNFQLDPVFHDKPATDSGSLFHLYIIQLHYPAVHVYGLPLNCGSVSHGIASIGPRSCPDLGVDSLYGVWFRWINYIDPVAYGFESLMINEFRNKKIPCAAFVPSGPGYMDVSPEQKICSTTGAAAGANFVDGNTYLIINYQYDPAHLWRQVSSDVHATYC
jgi:hypothetical protein